MPFFRIGVQSLIRPAQDPTGWSIYETQHFWLKAENEAEAQMRCIAHVLTLNPDAKEISASDTVEVPEYGNEDYWQVLINGGWISKDSPEDSIAEA